jgi:hypothetical protein
LVGDISESLNDFSQLLKEFGEKKKLKNNFKEIFLTDKNYFDLFIGKRLVKKDLVKIKGNIPIYSANVFNPVGYHNKSNIDDFDNNFVNWGIDGDFEFNFVEKNTPFVTTDHCGTIRILTHDILPEYLMLQLSKVKHKYGFDRGLRSSLKNMAQVSVEIPIDSTGKFDLQFQQDVLKKYQIIKEIKQKVEDYKKKIEELSVEIKCDSKHIKSVKISDLFNLPVIKGLTAKFIQSYKGNIPVYGGRIKEIPIGYIADNLKGVKYFKNCLAWNREGSVGYVFFHRHKFTTNDHHRPMIVKSEHIDLIDLDYMQYIVQDILLKQGFRWSKTASKEKIAKLLIKIPVTETGEFDLQKQKEIANKYKKIEEIKSNIKLELEKVENIKVDIGL